MKVRITFTVDVDVNAWAEAYGMDKSDVPNDVRAWAYHGILSQLQNVGALASDPFA